MEEYLPLIIQLVTGALGGNVAGKLLKNLSLGTVGNSIVGILGGGLGGQLLGMLGMGAGAAAGAEGGMDISNNFDLTNKKPKMKFFFLTALIVTMVGCSAQKTHDVAEIKTPKGDILVWLHDETPNHKASFIQLAKDGYWDSLTFNRVIPDFVAQGGCPDTPEGFNDPEYLLEPEFNDELLHEYGAEHRLDGDYTIFGKVIKGMDIVDAIVNVVRDSIDQPVTPITLDVNIVTMTEEELSEYDLPK